MPKKDRGWALDEISPVRFVATEIELAAKSGQPMLISEAARKYSHPVDGDLHRVKIHNGLEYDSEAQEWLIREALRLIAPWVHVNGDGAQFVEGKGFEDIRLKRKPIHREVNVHEKFRNPFDPLSGEFSENIRKDLDLGTGELRESMRRFGWIPELPAIKDERGVVLVGHRRLKIAEELRAEGVEIADQVTTIAVGRGDEADARRFRLAIAINVCFREMRSADKKRIAQYLYDPENEYGWTMERIGQALSVSEMQVSKYLAEDNSKPSLELREDKRGAPKGSGKPRKATPELVEKVKDDLPAFRENSVTVKDLATKHKVTASAIGQAIEILEKPERPLCPTCGQPLPEDRNDE